MMGPKRCDTSFGPRYVSFSLSIPFTNDIVDLLSCNYKLTGTRWPTKPMTTNEGQRRPAQANEGPRRPTRDNEGDMRAQTTRHVVWAQVCFISFTYSFINDLLLTLACVTDSAHIGQRRPMMANAGQHRHTKTNDGQHRDWPT
jgi:hypothetical protein